MSTVHPHGDTQAQLKYYRDLYWKTVGYYMEECHKTGAVKHLIEAWALPGSPSAERGSASVLREVAGIVGADLNPKETQAKQAQAIKELTQEAEQLGLFDGEF